MFVFKVKGCSVALCMTSLSVQLSYPCVLAVDAGVPQAF